MGTNNSDIVLYHYSFSPYAKRILWYLTLRGIDYAECKQPPVMPRPDVKALGINYRRIPLMAIKKDVYCDTRIILRKLEAKFPEGRLGASAGDQKAIEKLLEIWNVETVFSRAAALIPPDMPLLEDKKFQNDREDFSGRSWSKESMLAHRPEALAAVRNCFKFLETTLLADGRSWILKTDKPSLADIEAIWPFDWLIGLKGAIPKQLISETQFPKVFAWVKRFNEQLKEAKAKAPKPASLKGDAAAKRILEAGFAERDIGVNALDPLGLQEGQYIEIWPTDSGSRHRDRGTLVGLQDDELVIAAEGTGVRVHFPRSNFRVAIAGNGASKL